MITQKRNLCEYTFDMKKGNNRAPELLNYWIKYFEKREYIQMDKFALLDFWRTLPKYLPMICRPLVI